MVRRFIRTALGFLAAGLGLGFWMLVRRELFGRWPNPYLVSAHAHAMLAGFMLFLILGVALWLFPRPAADDRRYSPGRIRAAYWILTVGTLARLLTELARGLWGIEGTGWIVVAGGSGQVAGIALYFWSMWGRIRPVGSQLREAAGERF